MTRLIGAVAAETGIPPQVLADTEPYLFDAVVAHLDARGSDPDDIDFDLEG